MSEEIKAGDVVVRIKLPREAVTGATTSKLPGPPYGKMVRCVAVTQPYAGVCALIIEGWPSDHPSLGWHPEAFRKVPPASDEFTARIRACRPLNTEQPA